MLVSLVWAIPLADLRAPSATPPKSSQLSKPHLDIQIISFSLSSLEELERLHDRMSNLALTPVCLSKSTTTAEAVALIGNARLAHCHSFE
jgi:hypothetical protein